MVNAGVSVEEREVGEAAIAGGAGAATLLRARLALVIARDALVRLLVRALGAVRRALEVVKDQVFVKDVARCAHVRLAVQAGETWMTAAEFER